MGVVGVVVVLQVVPLLLLHFTDINHTYTYMRSPNAKMETRLLQATNGGQGVKLEPRQRHNMATLLLSQANKVGERRGQPTNQPTNQSINQFAFPSVACGAYLMMYIEFGSLIDHCN